MKKDLIFLLTLSVLFSCDKPFRLDLPLAVDSHEYSLNAKAGKARIFFYTTRPWTLATYPEVCSWATLNRTSGTGKEDVEEIILTYEANQDPDRQVTLIITAGDLQEKITVSQTGVAREWWDGSTTIDDLIIKP